MTSREQWLGKSEVAGIQGDMLLPIYVTMSTGEHEDFNKASCNDTLRTSVTHKHIISPISGRYLIYHRPEA